MNGDIGISGVALYQSIGKAAEIGDVAGVVHFSTWLANGLSVNGMPDRALPLLERAEGISRQAGRDTPFQLTIARIRAIAALPEPARGKAQTQMAQLVQDTLNEARRKETPGAQTDVLTLWAKQLMEIGAFAKAEPLLNEALTVARKATLPQEEAEALLLLSQLYRATGRASSATEVVAKAIATLQQVEDPHDLPVTSRSRPRLKRPLAI